MSRTALRDAFWRVWPPVWLAVMFVMLAPQFLTLGAWASELPAHPVGATLHATVSWVAVLFIAYSIDCHLTYWRLRPSSRPRGVQVLRDGVVIPVRLKCLGPDPFGTSSWMILGVVIGPDDELVAHHVPRDAALYFICEFGLVRITREDHDDETR